MKEERTATATSSVLYCTPCRVGPAAAYQDQRYGHRKRVHALTKQAKPKAERRWRCSVCGSEKRPAGEEAA